MPSHPIIHIEIPAADLAVAGKFYNEAFGWKTEHMPQFNYTTFAAEGGPGGGFNPVSAEMKVNEPLIYIYTADIEASLKQIEHAGGKTLMPRHEIPGVGWFAQFSDPSGNRMALFTPLEMGAGS